MVDVERYKRLFGIKGELVEFCPKELKRRWRILCQKYHPDHGGKDEHFTFVQEAYAYLKKKCKGREMKEEETFVSEMYGIREIKIDEGFHLWDIGEADFRKRAEHFRKTGTHSVHIKRKSYGYR